MKSFDPHAGREETRWDRLISAADAIIAAGTRGSSGTVRMWRDDRRPSAEGYSSAELMDAMAFLHRLGLVNAEGIARAF